MLTSKNIINAKRDLPFSRKRVFNAVRQLIKFAHLFTNRTKTVDGTRYLVNQGDKSEPENLIVNGDFATGDFTGWDTSYWSVVDNTASMPLDGGGKKLQSDTILIAGITYKLTFELLALTNSLKWQINFVSGGSESVAYSNSTGLIESTFTPTSDGRLAFYDNGSGSSATIDNIKVYPLSEAPAQDAVMHTGQGAYFNGQDNYIPISGAHSLSDECTILLGFSPTALSDNVNGILTAGGGEAIGAIKGGELTLKWLSTLYSFDVPVSDYNDIAVVTNFQDFSLYANGEFAKAITTPSYYKPASFNYIAARNGSACYTGILDYCTIIPKALTAQEISNHCNNPEQTLYWDNGTLKSDILDQATIDSMQAGNGFWYPLTENVSAGGYYRNHALPMAVNKVSDDFSLWFQPSGGWTVNADGSATMAFIDSWTPLGYEIEGFIQQDYIIEFELTDVTGSVRCASLPSDYNAAQIGIVISSITSNGVYRALHNSTNSVIAFGRQYNEGGGSCTVKSVKVYPLANSGLTPLTNYTETTSTNAQQLTSGYQCALQELDPFGLPIGKPDGLLHGDGRGYIDLQDQVISGDFKLDIYLGESIVLADSYDHLLKFNGYDSAGNSLGNLSIYQSSGSLGRSIVLFNTTVGLNTEAAVVSVKLEGDVFSVYKNGLFINSSSAVTGIDYLELYSLMAKYRGVLGDVYENSLSNLQIQKGTFTAEEVANDAQKLMTKYGVTA